MRIQRVTAVFFLSGFIASSAFAFGVKSGEWEMVVTSGGGELSRQKICIGPEDAKAYYEPSRMAGRGAPKDCKMNVSQGMGGAASFQMTCDLHGMKTETKGTIKKVSDNEIQSEGTITTLIPGQKEPMKSEQKTTVKRISDSEIVTSTTMSSSAAKGMDQQITIREKFVGPTCDKDAKPWPPSFDK